MRTAPLRRRLLPPRAYAPRARGRAPILGFFRGWTAGARKKEVAQAKNKRILQLLLQTGKLILEATKNYSILSLPEFKKII